MRSDFGKIKKKIFFKIILSTFLTSIIGLLITLLNIVLARKALRTVHRSAVDRVFAGFAVGMAAAVPVAAVRAVPLVGGALWMLLARVLPWALILAGVGCLGWTLWKARQIQPAGQGAGK